MSENALQPAFAPVHTASLHAWVRYRSSPESLLCPAHGCIQATLLDISVCTAYLLLNRAFWPGTSLELRLEGPAGVCHVPARVTDCRLHDGLGWDVACEFREPLTDAELLALLG